MRLDQSKLLKLRAREAEALQSKVPKSRALYARGCHVIPHGVPCSWMAAFYPGTEIFAARGAGAHFEDGYARVTALGAQLADGIDALIAARNLPWRAFRLGNRSGLCLAETPLRNAAEAARAISKPLNLAARAYMANRGVWEPIYIHGPSISFAHGAADVRSYLGALEGFLDLVVREAMTA